ncbi:MAG: NAD(P)/FAD-dependent oxidoreductase [bacterium]|nr:NAD(P)/FAD-dependent oxidoreductase [bacterium]
MKHVIIGAGIAGITAAETIKQVDYEAEVVLIGVERFFPYRRYLLTEFLCGSVENEDLVYTQAGSLKESGITMRKGQYVKSLNPEEKSIKLEHNEVVHYDKLLIATGGRPGLGPTLRPYKKYIDRYYSLKDVLLLKQKLVSVKSCIVFGEGLSSLDLVLALHKLGKKVTYIVKSPRVDFGSTETDPDDEQAHFLGGTDVEVITDDRIISVEPVEDYYKVMTLKKKELVSDIVFAWDYYKPNIPFIQGTRIEKNVGILVNRQMKTSEEDIYAAGDCVEIYNPLIRDYWINWGWSSAMEQGAIAGKNMVGLEESYQIQESQTFKILRESVEARWWK